MINRAPMKTFISGPVKTWECVRYKLVENGCKFKDEQISSSFIYSSYIPLGIKKNVGFQQRSEKDVC